MLDLSTWTLEQREVLIAALIEYQVNNNPNSRVEWSTEQLTPREMADNRRIATDLLRELL